MLLVCSIIFQMVNGVDPGEGKWIWKPMKGWFFLMQNKNFLDRTWKS